MCLYSFALKCTCVVLCFCVDMSVRRSVTVSRCSNVTVFDSFHYIGLFYIVYVMFKLFDQNI